MRNLGQHKLKTSRQLGIIAIMALVVLTGSAATAAEDANSQPLGVGFTLDYFTKYIWRGQNLNDESVFQPSVYFSKYGFTGTIWSTQDWTNINGESGEFTEVDYSLEYSNTVPGMDGIDWLVGVINYDPVGSAGENTTEIYGSLALSEFPLAPSITLYRDVDEVKGTYYQFSLGHTIEKIGQWKDPCYCDLELGASTGYGNSMYNKGNFDDVSDGKFNDLTLSAALPIYMGNGWIIKPSINYSTMLAGTIRDATDNSDNLWCGVGLSVDF